MAKQSGRPPKPPHVPKGKFPGPFVLGANLTLNDGCYVGTLSAVSGALNDMCSDSDNNHGGGQEHINAIINGVWGGNNPPRPPDHGYTPSAALVASAAAYVAWRG